MVTMKCVKLGRQIDLIPDIIYLGNPLDKNSGLDWPGVLRIFFGLPPARGNSEIESALSASFSFENLF